LDSVDELLMMSAVRLKTENEKREREKVLIEN
jgi:hypothetical protein